MYILKSLASNLLSLLFPRLCSACSTPLIKTERHICLHCLQNLPYTDYHIYQDNRVARQFWGRVPIYSAMAMLHFKKGGSVQQLVHHLKYKGQTGLGIQLGELIGARLIQNVAFSIPDLIIPVPLHPAKQRKRSYNQCTYIADGIASVLKIPVYHDIQIKHKNTGSQTRKGRFERSQNLKDAFSIKNLQLLSNAHVLLVDDVITTGATLEACALLLLEESAKSISIAAIGFSD
ncbi:ComF family protein [Pedobacter duraquae]|uniref:ComF family protein n=2 Tax=Pedobacter duraquae TaxID=425511 RepID=A0A4R6IAZ1_9SPHI|nr:phosphoribosyltransferase family protein [Pedobacter duraquae]TDO19082.1 ComF family protein [Pedobacter duraquae]